MAVETNDTVFSIDGHALLFLLISDAEILRYHSHFSYTFIYLTAVSAMYPMFQISGMN